MHPNIYNKNEVKNIPIVVPKIIFNEPTPVITIKPAPSNTANVDVSPMEPGIKPRNKDVHDNQHQHVYT